MKKFKIQWTNFAIKSIGNIKEYITNESKSITPANKLINKIFKKIEILETNPYSFQEEPFLKDKDISARYIVVNKIKIIYVINNDTVTITDVFNSKQHQSKIRV